MRSLKVMSSSNLKDLEPSPGRNFTNPQNLESFEKEAVKHAFGVYGYGNS